MSSPVIILFGVLFGSVIGLIIEMTRTTKEIARLKQLIFAVSELKIKDHENTWYHGSP